MERIETLQKTFREWYEKYPINNPVCLNLSLKQGINITPRSGTSIQKISDYDISSNIRHFLNRVNQKIFKNSFVRNDKRLSVIPIVEGIPPKRKHCHIIIERPDRLDLRSFSHLVETCWIETYWGYYDNKIVDMRDIGYLEYILKLKTKTDIFDSIDWLNLHLDQSLESQDSG